MSFPGFPRQTSVRAVWLHLMPGAPAAILSHVMGYILRMVKWKGERSVGHGQIQKAAILPWTVDLQIFVNSHSFLT